MLKTAIILAGGFGTRLQHILPDVPKPMAPINGHPFLKYLLFYCKQQGMNKIILSIGYKHEQIVSYFGKSYADMLIEYVIEDKPLGTGGAIKKSLQACSADDYVVILNGDTFFPIDMKEMMHQHLQTKAALSIALKPMQYFERYGSVLIDEDKHIVSFLEKKYCSQGYINGGIYICQQNLIEKLPAQDSFSFETDYLNIATAQKAIYGYISDAYFIDIGIPEDYARAQSELPRI